MGPEMGSRRFFGRIGPGDRDEKISVSASGGGPVVVTPAEGKTLSEAVGRQAVKDAGFTLRSLKKIQGGE